MAVMTLREKHHPLIPCMCPRCRAAVLALPDGARRWEQRAQVALGAQRVLRKRMVDSQDDECDRADRRRAERREAEAAVG